MKTNPFFKEDEFKCRCGRCAGLPAGSPPDELVEILTTIRRHFDSPVMIRSAYRCPAHNARVGGAPKSRHLVGDAVDFVVIAIPTKEVYEFCENLPNADKLGLAIKHNPTNQYAGFVHLDTRGVKARWVYK